jgi:xanthine dehydrogenase accessory factor
MQPRVLYEHLARLRAGGRAFAVATVVRTQGSTPQVAGARLVVTEDDASRPMGTLGGGCVEADAILAARNVLAHGGRSLRAYELNETLAWNSGLVCGGTMWILVEPGHDATTCDGRDVLDRLTRSAAGGSPIAWVTRLSRKQGELAFGGRVLVDVDGRAVGTFGDPALDRQAAELAVPQLRHGTPRTFPGDDSEWFVDPVAGRPRVIIAGGGHVSKAIARQARMLEFDVTVLEDRPEFADPERFDGATVLTGSVPDTIRTLEFGWQTYLVIATRGHKMDADCVLAAAGTAAPYIGLLGSRRKTILIENMLREANVPDERIQAVWAPIGLDLGGRTPAEIALSVMAEITALRYRGTGRSLRRPGQSEGARACG